MDASSSPILSPSAKKKAKSPSPQPRRSAVGFPSTPSRSPSMLGYSGDVLNNSTNASGMMTSQEKRSAELEHRKELLDIRKEITCMLQATVEKRQAERKEDLQMDREMQEKLFEMADTSRIDRKEENAKKAAENLQLIERWYEEQLESAKLRYERKVVCLADQQRAL